MTFHLHPDIFDIVKNGSKNVEVRLNDEKRRTLKIGDEIIFLKRPNEEEKIVAKITNLKYYDSFDSLVVNYPIERLFLSNYTNEMFLKELERFYSKDEQDKYGVVAIEFEKKG